LTSFLLDRKIMGRNNQLYHMPIVNTINYTELKNLLHGDTLINREKFEKLLGNNENKEKESKYEK